MVTDPPPLVHEVHFSLPVGEKPTVPGPPPPSYVVRIIIRYQSDPMGDNFKQTLKFFTVQYRST